LDLTVIAQDITKIDTDAVVVSFHEDVRPLRGGAGQIDWILCGALSRLIIEKHIRGVLGEVALVTSAGKIPAPKVFLVGLGPREGSSPDSLRRAARAAASSVAGAGVARAALSSAPIADGLSDETLQALRQGLTEGAAGRRLSIVLAVPDAATIGRMERALLL
jgi:hypothetical protein